MLTTHNYKHLSHGMLSLDSTMHCDIVIVTHTCKQVTRRIHEYELQLRKLNLVKATLVFLQGYSYQQSVGLKSLSNQ